VDRPNVPQANLNYPSLHWERWEALRQLCLAHETLSMAAWSEAIHRRALQVGVDDPAPDHQLEISRARELLKENAWAARQSSWHRRGLPRPGPCKRHLTGGRLEKRPLGMTQPPTPNPQDGAKILGAVVSLGVFLYVGYMFYGGGVEKEAAETMRTIEQQVATDSEAQYNITKQSGTAIDRGGAEEAGGPTRPTTGLF